MSYVLDAERAQHTAGCPCRLCDTFRPNPRARRSPVKRRSDREVAEEEHARAEYAESELARLRELLDTAESPPEPPDLDPAELARYLDEVPPEDFEAYEGRVEPIRVPVRRLSSRKDPWLTVRKWGRGF